MPQITLYIDEETDAKARAAARAAGVSYSKWVTELIRSRTRDEWPETVRKLAGSRLDFPLRGADANTMDVPRVSLD
ncbi:MAG: CopG family transcriptional regulator [Steroidobacteraceae bacterium]